MVWRIVSRLLPLVSFVGLSAAVLGGCSILGPDRVQDDQVLTTQNYRRPNVKCEGVNLSTSIVDVKTFRGLIQCLNDNHSIDEIDRWINGGVTNQVLPKTAATGSAGFKDSELAPIVDHLNRFVLNDKRKLFAIEKLHEHLSQAALLDDGLHRFGELLEDRELLLSFLKVVKESFFSIKKGEGGDVYVPDPEFLYAVELIAKRLEGDELIGVLELGIGLVESKAFQQWIQTFGSSSQIGLDLPELVLAVFSYLKADHQYVCRPAPGAQGVLRDIRADLLLATFGASAAGQKTGAGQPFQVLDQLLGQKPSELLVKAPRLVAFLDELLKDSKGKYEGTKFAGPSLAQELSRSLADLNAPIACLFDGAGQSSVQVPNASRHLLFELAKLPAASLAPALIERQLPVELMALGPFCKFPDSLNAGYRNLTRLSQTRIEWDGVSRGSESAAVVLAEAVRALHSVRTPWPGCGGGAVGNASVENERLLGGGDYYPFLSWLVEALADRGGAQGQAGIVRLLPVLSELSSRGSLTPALLLLGSLDSKTRQSLVSWMEFFFIPREDLKVGTRSRSLFDVFANALTRQSVGTVVSMLRTLGKHSSPNFAEIGSGLKTLHKAYYVNDTHPLVELLLEALRDARKNGPFYGSVLLATEKPGFEEAIAAISKMARREDGRLKTLLGSVTSLFHKFAEEGQFEIRKASRFPEPRGFFAHQPDPKNAAKASIRKPPHSTGSLASNSNLNSASVPGSGPEVDCFQLDLNFSIAQVSDPRFLEQIRWLAGCQGDGEVKEVVEYLVSPSLGPDRSFFRVFSNLISDAVFGGGVQDRFDRLNIDYVNNKLLKLTGPSRALDVKAEFKKLAKSLRVWIEGTSDSQKSGRLPLLEPVFELVGKLLEQGKESVLRFEAFLAGELQDDDFPKRLETLDELAGKLAKVLEKREALVKAGAADRYFTPSLMDEVQRAVDRFECDLTPEQRKVRYKEVIDHAKNNLSVGTPYATLRELDFDFLRPYLQVISRKFSDPKQNRSNYSVLKAHLKFFRRFRLESPRRSIIPDPEVTPLYTPEFFLKWIQNRAVDYRPVAIVPHGCLVRTVNEHGEIECKKYYTAQSAKVFLYNTMNRFDSVLYQVSFDTPALPFRPTKNLGLEFSYEVGHAWGDQDPENWPDGIKNPVSMTDAVKNIVQRPARLENVDFLSSLIGYPKKFPSCFGSDPIWPSARLDFIAGWIPRADLPAFKARLFNLRGTTFLKGLKEVLADQAFRGVDNTPAGLEILRDLFWEIHQSTPDAIRSAPNLSSLGMANNLALIPMTVELGMLTQLARFVQPFEKDDETLTDFVVTLVDFVGSPEFERLVNELFKQEDGASKLSNLAIRAIDLFELIQKQPEAKRNWDELLKQLDRMKENSSVSRADADKLLRTALDFLEEKDLENPKSERGAEFIQRDTARKLRRYVARHLAQGDFDEIVQGVRKDQPGFAKLLKTLIRYLGADEGGIPKFVERLRESLDEPIH